MAVLCYKITAVRKDESFQYRFAFLACSRKETKETFDWKPEPAVVIRKSSETLPAGTAGMNLQYSVFLTTDRSFTDL